jgi:hypothetical protein
LTNDRMLQTDRNPRGATQNMTHHIRPDHARNLEDNDSSSFGSSRRLELQRRIFDSGDSPDEDDGSSEARTSIASWPTAKPEPVKKDAMQKARPSSAVARHASRTIAYPLPSLPQTSSIRRERVVSFPLRSYNTIRQKTPTERACSHPQTKRVVEIIQPQKGQVSPQPLHRPSSCNRSDSGLDSSRQSRDQVLISTHHAHQRRRRSSTYVASPPLRDKYSSSGGLPGNAVISSFRDPRHNSGSEHDTPRSNEITRNPTGSTKAVMTTTGHYQPDLNQPPTKHQYQQPILPLKRRSGSFGPSGVIYETDSSWDPSSSQSTSVVASQFPPRRPADAGAGGSTSARLLDLNHISSWMAGRAPRSSSSPDDSESMSASVSSQSVSSATDHESPSSQRRLHEIESSWQAMRTIRSTLARIRADMAQSRKALRNLRTTANEIDNKFMRAVRPMLVAQKGGNQVSRLPLVADMESLQRARNDTQLAEIQYEKLEDMLDEHENLLMIAETRFFSLLAADRVESNTIITHLTKTHPPDEPRKHAVSDNLRGISSGGPAESLHPLYLRLAATAGDLQNVKEDYQNLTSAKEHYDFDLSVRETTNQPSTSSMHDFLEEYETEEPRLRQLITELSTQVSQLRRECEERNVMRKHLSAHMTYLLYPEDQYEEMDLEQPDAVRLQRKNLGHLIFSEILSQPDHVLASPVPLTSLGALRKATRLPNDDPRKSAEVRKASKEYVIENLIKDSTPADKNDFVNRWLLQGVQTSPMQVLLLYSKFMQETALHIQDIMRWQQDVLRLWWNEDVVPMDAAHSTPPESRRSSIAAPTRPHLLSKALSDEDMRIRRLQQDVRLKRMQLDHRRSYDAVFVSS